MPVDFQSMSEQVKRWGADAPNAAAALNESFRQATVCLVENAARLDELSARVARATRAYPALRCATPAGERLDAAFPLPAGQPPATILAADGSQINPDRHAQVEFCVINVGTFEMPADASIPPRERIESRLLPQAELHAGHGMIGEEMVALKRDLSERQFLARLAAEASRPVVALTDGPIELFSERDLLKTPEFQSVLEDYLKALRDLSHPEISFAGYVDKPGSDLVVRLLELARLPENSLERPNQERVWPSLTDARLFGQRLRPGERSALFGIQSMSAQSFTDELALHFFYLNVGKPEHPWIARVEIPAWVGGVPPALNRLHAALVWQAGLLGAKPYPYALHRAHEVACVTFDEKDQLEEMMVAEMLRRGVQPEEISNKQNAKNLAGRTRYS